MNSIFILCLDLFFLSISSGISGYISYIKKIQFYMIYDCYLLAWIIVILLQFILCGIRGFYTANIIFYIKKVTVVFLGIIMLYATGIYSKQEKGLLVAAVLEEIIYRGIGISYISIFFNNVWISVIIITGIFLLNHSFVIIDSRNKVFSFLVLFVLNALLIILRINVGIISCVFVHLIYDVIVIKQNKFC